MRSYATEKDKNYQADMEDHLQNLSKKIPLSKLVNNFSKYAKRQEMTRFLARHELFKKVLKIQGCIIECGVFSGQGLMTWAQISSILEPVGGAFRHIYGFDTFSGFPKVHEKDLQGSVDLDWKKGDLTEDSYEDLKKCIELFDQNRFLPQFPKVSLIKGDFSRTASDFLKQNPHLLISLLYLDFDLYEPTKIALELFLPRMPKGSIIGFDEINHPLWPGETLALLEKLNIRDYKIEKFPYEINISYLVL